MSTDTTTEVTETEIILTSKNIEVTTRQTKDGTVGHIKVAPADYKKNRPTGMTDATEKMVDEYRTAYVAQVIEDAGPVALEAMANDESMDKVVVKATMGTSSIVATVQAEGSMPVGFGQKERKAVYGKTTLRVKTPYGAAKGKIKSSMDRLEAAARLKFEK